MKNSPSDETLQNVNVPNFTADLIDESRAQFGNVTSLNAFAIFDQFDLCSEKYVIDPSPDNLFKMAEIIYPVSQSTALMYYKSILNKDPFHQEAQSRIEQIEKAIGKKSNVFIKL